MCADGTQVSTSLEFFKRNLKLLKSHGNPDGFCSWSCTQSGPPRTPNLKRDEKGIKWYKYIEIDSGILWVSLGLDSIQGYIGI
jgi:hypothetical protein